MDPWEPSTGFAWNGRLEKGFASNERWQKGFAFFPLVLHPFECRDKSQRGAPELQLPLVKEGGSTGVLWVQKSDFRFTKQSREIETIPVSFQGQLLLALAPAVPRAVPKAVPG